MSLLSKVFLAGFCLFGVLLSGCLAVGGVGPGALRGFLFTNVTIPYSLDLEETPFVSGEARGRTLRISEPFSGVGFYARFDSNAVGDIARAHGLSRVYFADLEIFSILGIWRHEEIHLYGE